jgi:hypothetical protein
LNFILTFLDEGAKKAKQPTSQGRSGGAYKGKHPLSDESECLLPSGELVRTMYSTLFFLL